MRSRKAIALATLALVTIMAAGPARAQIPMAPKAEFGIKAGFNISDINQDDLKSSTRSGIVGGAYLDISSFLFHLQIEALISRRGYDGQVLTQPNPMSDPTLLRLVDIQQRNTTIQIPALVVFAIPLPFLSPRAYAGPAFNIPLKSEVRRGDGDWTDIDDDTKNAWSLIAGVGVKVWKVGVDVRYDIGLTALNERTMDEIYGDIIDDFYDQNNYKDIKDRTFAVTVSFALN